MAKSVVHPHHVLSDLFLVQPSGYCSTITTTAESFAHVVPDLLLEKLDSIIAQEGIGPEIETELRMVRATVSAIQDLVLVAEGQQTRKGFSDVGNLLYSVKQTMDSISNLLDELQLGVSRIRRAPQRNNFWSIKREVSSLFSRSNSPPSKISHIEEVRKQLRRIIESQKAILNLFLNANTALDMHVSYKLVRMSQKPSVGVSDIIGRDRDKKIIVQLLLRGSMHSQNVSVLPIVGVGGIGKTTLAKWVYDDAEIVAHFRKRMWVCVSENFNITKIIKEMIHSATGTEQCGDLTLDQLQARLRHILKGIKFLLVLDDVWNRDRQKWLKLRALLMGGAPGSKIVVTTRKIGVGPLMGTIQTYLLGPLQREDSWSLFRKHLGIRRPNVMEELDRHVIDNCGGIPLQLRMLGSLMGCSGNGAQDWTSVRDDAIWKSEYFPALKLSYERLPPHLKPCFSFCSIFPKNSEIRSDDLVQLWIMHDLIKPTTNHQNNIELEEIGNDYIKELWRRSFFQNLEEREHGAWFGIRIHDLIHDLAVSVAQKENAMVSFGAKNIPRNIRHVSFSDEDWSSHEQRVQTFLGQLTDVQTIIFPADEVGMNNGELCESIITTCFERFKSLVMLDLSCSGLKALPDSISGLTNLKYLGLKRNYRIMEIPDSISRLTNLKTLDVGGCSGLEKLPKSIEKLVDLRHSVITTKGEALLWLKSMKSIRYLGLVGCVNLKCLPGGSEVFNSLRSLFIHRCPSLVSLPPNIRRLSALKILRIDDCEKLDLENGVEEKAPEILLPSLRLLVIVKLPRLETLPKWILHGAASASNTSLERIVIEACSNFRGLPKEVLQNSFHKFKIEDCPQVAGLCPRMITKDKATPIFRTCTLPVCKKLGQLKPVEEVNRMKQEYYSPGRCEEA